MATAIIIIEAPDEEYELLEAIALSLPLKAPRRDVKIFWDDNNDRPADIGRRIAEDFGMAPAGEGNRYETQGGTKTPLGIFRTVLRHIREG